MILTCPDCATRFLIKQEAIGPNGRTVRCSQCSSTWFVAGDPDVLSLTDNIQASENPAMQREPDAAPPLAQPDQDLEHGIEHGDKGGAPSQAAASIADAPHFVIRDREAERKSRRRIMGVGMIWGLTLLILIAFALMAYFFRTVIAEKFPGTIPVYKAFGIEASTSGLQIFDVETFHGSNEGTPVLFLNGKIKNYDFRLRNVALVKLSFMNANGEPVASWVVEPERSVLEPGAELAFVSQYPNPPIDAVELIPSFVDENMQDGMTLQSPVPMASSLTGSN